MANLYYEKKFLNKGYRLIAGVDEVGIGSYAGDVYACAVILDFGKPRIYGIRDSKMLTAKERERLYPIIIQRCLEYKIALTPVAVIKELGYNWMVKASIFAMTLAVKQLERKPDIVLVDGDRRFQLDIDIPALNIIGGDKKSLSIASASIIAKVMRDNYMIEMDKLYRKYGFERNKGYGTKEHKDAILKYGICPIHRANISWIKNTAEDG